MLRKLASFFFQEEEIVLEEDLKEEAEENYKIPEIKPIKARRAPDKPAEQEVKVSPEDEKVSLEDTNNKEETVEESAVKDNAEKTNKSKKILADTGQGQSEAKKAAIKQIKQEEYQPQEIISPIFGGSQKPTPKAVTVEDDKEEIKINKTKTTVISPMYGMMEEDVNEIFDKDLLNYELKDMLSASENADEVQVTLYDFLEETEDDK